MYLIKLSHDAISLINTEICEYLRETNHNNITFCCVLYETKLSSGMRILNKSSFNQLTTGSRGTYVVGISA